MRRTAVVLVSSIVFDVVSVLQEIGFHKALEKAIMESKPEQLRTMMAKHITLSQAQKNSYLKKAQEISEAVRLRLLTRFDYKDILRITVGTYFSGAGILLLFLANDRLNQVSSDWSNLSQVNQISTFRSAMIAIALSGILVTYGSLECVKGWSQYDRTDLLNRALATQVELNKIAIE
jgi:hypothetical protein